MPSKLIGLNCPSCGGALELPNTLTIAHCVYCGNKILFDEERVVQERRDLARYIELCKVAAEAKNHSEVIGYCNRILEIDPHNIEAWINKAVSTSWLTTGAHNRYDEAIEYLNKASRIAPSDERIAMTRQELTKQQALWYMHLAGMVAETSGDAVEEMTYYLIASDYDPDNLVILERISRTARFANSVNWSDKVRTRIRRLYVLKGETKSLNELKQDLQMALSKFTKPGHGPVIRMLISREIEWLRSEIATLEKQAS